MTQAVEKRTRRRLALLFCVPLAFCFLLFFVDVISERTDARLLQSHTLHSSVSQLWSLAQSVESAERGFLLTGDQRDLIPLQQADAMLNVDIDACERNASGDRKIEPMVRNLTQLVRGRFRQANKAVDMMRTRGSAPALAIIRSRTAELTMNRMHKQAIDLLAVLDHQERAYLERDHWASQASFGFFLAGTLITMGVLAWLYRTLVSYLHERDSASAQLAALNAELEARIAERTRELQESNTELQQFAYVASHDLQEPLRTITSFTQLLEERYQGRLDEDADEFIGYIVTSARRMGDLINGLLALGRLRKSGHASVPVSFETILKEAEVSLQASIRESGCSIEHGPLPTLVVDRVQFAQVLQNLISNAIKYRREEPPAIRVNAVREESDWVFSVSDNGQGFHQQYAERIFGMFQRLHSRKIEGTGIGLSIAKKIVERHGGRMWATSAEGIGSTFFFSLPVSLEISRPEPAAAGSANPRDPQVAAQQQAVGGARQAEG